jgi:hypothetical protein
MDSRKSRTLPGIVAIGIVGLAALASAQAGKVQGTATVDATKVTLVSGAAVGYKAPNGQLVSVLLSDKPVDPKAFATDTKIGAGERYTSGIFEGAWKSQHMDKKLSGFVFTIGPKNRVMGEEFEVGSPFSIGSDEYVVDITSTSPRLVGRIHLKTPVYDTGEQKVGLDATFDLAVEMRK